MPRPLNDPEGGPGVLLTARVPGAMKDEVRAVANKLGVPYGRVVAGAISLGLALYLKRAKDHVADHGPGPLARAASVAEVRYDKVPEVETRSEEVALREGQGPKPKAAGTHRWKLVEGSLTVKECSVCEARRTGAGLLKNDCPGGGE